MHNFKSHFQDFLAYCTRPVSVHLVMVSVSCSFSSFSVFLCSLKQQQNLMKIMFSWIHFPIWPYSPQNNEKLYFILVNCMGWQVWALCVWYDSVHVSVFILIDHLLCLCVCPDHGSPTTDGLGWHSRVAVCQENHQRDCRLAHVTTVSAGSLLVHVFTSAVFSHPCAVVSRP